MEELNFHDLAKLMLHRFKEFRADENSKHCGWWDYLPLDEETRNQLFFEAYRSEFARATVAYLDHTKSDVLAMPKAKKWSDNASNKKWIDQARQAADMLQIEYPRYCRLMFAFYAEKIGKSNKLATPENMRNEYAILHVSLCCETLRSEGIMRYANHPCYLAENYRGFDFQKRYGEYLIREIKRKAVPQYSLVTALFEKRQLSIVQALENFEIEVLRKARLLFCTTE